MGFLGRGCTDQHSRVFCTSDHRAQYLMLNPSRCDNCSGVIHASRLDTEAERFCSRSCAVEYTPLLHDQTASRPNTSCVGNPGAGHFQHALYVTSEAAE
jgi:hypothetical protein